MNGEPGNLNVWIGDRVVADLTVSRRGVPQLRYRPDYVAERGVGALGLSVPLPVAMRPYKGERVDFWIESLLPEGETRTVLERYFRIRRGDGFRLLAAIGRDCAGAVAVTSAEQPPQAMSGPLQPLTESEVGEAVAALRQHPLGVDEDVRVSLGGLQSKLLLVQVDGGWARPLGGMPSTHILKPDPPEFPGLVASEAFAQRAAALAGLSAAESRLDTFGGKTVIVVTRFDRVAKGRGLVRRHQEDGCQALGIDPTGMGKYQTPNGAASYRRLAKVFDIYSGDRSAELRRLAAMLTFTVAIGNTDAHLRNHAFLHRRNDLSLAPIYDASPTAEFAGTRELALWVDGQSLLGVVTRDHIIREAASWGLSLDKAEEVVESTLARLADVYDEAARETPEVSRSVVQACQRRTGKLLRQG
ncbi:MAG: HipA domain-containing protein [Streptosporangiales bacterium]|nr:HipA domain-containing protein [Streptosporangiales bacterium]